MADARDDKSIQSVQVALRVLEELANNRGPMGVTEIAHRIGTPKARVYRHLRTLLAQGYVEQDARTEKYRLGIKLYQLGRAAGDQIDLLTEARRFMQQLSDSLQLTVTIGRPVDDGVFIVDMLRADTPLEISTRPGYVLPFHASAQGKIALAFGAPGLCERVLAAPLERLNSETIVDPARLRAEVNKARMSGWAVAPGEVLTGLNALAAPIFSADGRLEATITVVGTVQGLPARPRREMIYETLEAARAISHALGYREPADAARRQPA